MKKLIDIEDSILLELKQQAKSNGKTLKKHIEFIVLNDFFKRKNKEKRLALLKRGLSLKSR